MKTIESLTKEIKLDNMLKSFIDTIIYTGVVMVGEKYHFIVTCLPDCELKQFLLLTHKKTIAVTLHSQPAHANIVIGNYYIDLEIDGECYTDGTAFQPKSLDAILIEADENFDGEIRLSKNENLLDLENHPWLALAGYLQKRNLIPEHIDETSIHLQDWNDEKLTVSIKSNLCASVRRDRFMLITITDNIYADISVILEGLAKETTDNNGLIDVSFELWYTLLRAIGVSTLTQYSNIYLDLTKDKVLFILKY